MAGAVTLDRGRRPSPRPRLGKYLAQKAGPPRHHSRTGACIKMRADKQGRQRTEFDKNKRRILATQSVCGICGMPVDKTLRYPHPLAPTVDHIIPLNKGGHPSSMENLQLAHWMCNRQKSDKVLSAQGYLLSAAEAPSPSSEFPLARDWATYKR